MKRCLALLGGVVLGLIIAISCAAGEFDAGRAPLQVLVNGKPLVYRVAFHTMLPADVLVFRNPNPGPNSDRVMRVRAPSNTVELTTEPFSWRAPSSEPGTYTFVISQGVNEITLQVFVLMPYDRVRNGYINHFRVGRYPAPLRGLDSYKPPAGFIEVSETNSRMSVSPHFTLGQFLCKQSSTFPKYMVLNPRLLEKLELLLEEVNSKGIRTDGFTVMSGYRTPYYNQAIGNVPNSRHIYGGAADLFVDVRPRDDVMDDLNGDGRTDENDAAYLYRLFDTFADRQGPEHLRGGLGQYRPNAAHGAFVHVDVRGTRARWGHTP